MASRDAGGNFILDYAEIYHVVYLSAQPMLIAIIALAAGIAGSYLVLQGVRMLITYLRSA